MHIRLVHGVHLDTRFGGMHQPDFLFEQVPPVGKVGRSVMGASALRGFNSHLAHHIQDARMIVRTGKGLCTFSMHACIDL